MEEEIAVMVVMTSFAAALVLIVYFLVKYRTERVRIASGGGEEYRRLAEEAVRAQTKVLDEVRQMNGTLREIERLLREV